VIRLGSGAGLAMTWDGSYDQLIFGMILGLTPHKNQHNVDLFINKFDDLDAPSATLARHPGL
jgi:hypothetical protein